MRYSTSIFILLTCFLFSCSDLKEDTTRIKTFDEHFETSEEAENFILPVYQVLTPDAYFHRHIMLDGVISDEIVRPSQGFYGEGVWLNVQRHQLDNYASENANNSYWYYLYSSIEQCNILLETLQASSFPEVAAPYIAELKVLRAFFYLQLIDSYGNVPIVEEDDVLSQTCTSPRTEVFAFIEKSLLENLPLLSKNIGGRLHGRMNFYVAQALLAKLYLNAEVYRGAPAWSETAAACDAILDAGVFNLSDDYFDNFKVNSKNSPENILVAACFYQNCPWYPPYFYSLHGTHLSNLIGSDVGYWGNSLVVQPDFYSRYDSQDARIKSFFVGEQFDKSGNPILDLQADSTDPDGLAINYTPEINLDFPLRQAGIRFAKFEIDTLCDSSISNCAFGTHEYPILRYADVLLMKAEALLRLNANSGEALALVNAVRERSGAVPFGDLSLEKLLDERGRELFLEGWRRSDLIRFGKFNDAWWEKEADANTYVNLFPIPWGVIYQNPCVVQNPGY